MKVALITIKSPHNYGAVLQRFATFEYLRKKGFDIEVIDYYPKKFKKNKSFIKQTIMKLVTKGRRDRINEFNKERIITTDSYESFEALIENPPVADVYIVGSDQVWNSQLSKGTLDPAFFLDFATNKKKISYASSMGRSDVSENELNCMRDYLMNFTHISVREESAKQLLNKVGVENVEVVLDPVFLLGRRDYETLAKPVKYENYVLIYSFEKNPVIEDLAQKIAQNKKIKIIEVGTYRSKYSNDKYLQNIGVEEFLSLLKNASFVITSSFHGTAFSVLLNKQFVSVAPSIRGTRLENIVNILGIKERLITKKDCYDLEELLKPIDYEAVNHLVNLHSEKSRSFLEDTISSKKSI